MTLSRVLLTLSLIASAAAASGQSPSSRTVIMRGMSVDFRLVNEKQRKLVTPSLEKQIDVALTVEMPASVGEFFRTVAIVVDPAMLSTATNGQYMQNDTPPFIRIKPVELPGERAILLHELLHAYHHQVLKQPTPDVEGAYRRALQADIYPSEFLKAAFMHDSREYFANMATTFLLGKSERPPYDCSTIATAQPKFVAYLGSLFGPRECNVR
jgi:hypothetical protein